jgi:amino acid adenylation domain-containing protein
VQCVSELFERRAAEFPARTALVASDRELSYAALDAESQQLAHFLRKRGIGAEDRVIVALERTSEAIVAMLGVLKAGAAYVPISSRLPYFRLVKMVSAARPALFLCDAALADEARALVPVCTVAEAQCDVTTDGGPRRPRASRSLAYIAFTSGSTGEPKSVGVERRQLNAYVAALLRLTRPYDLESYASVSPLWTDLGNTALFGALASGASLHLIDEYTAMDPVAFGDHVRRHAVDCIKTTPSHLAHLLRSGGGPEIFPRRLLMLGGEAVRADLLTRIHAARAPCDVVNSYGPTECAVAVAAGRVECAPETDRVSLVRALAANQLQVFDAEAAQGSPRMVGELWVTGPSVARGYIDRPGLTAAQFVPRPHGARAYRTGDRAQLHDDNTVVILGRLDRQLKIRGFRIEPAEIEVALNRHPAIVTSCVLSVALAENVPALAAVVVVCDGVAVTDRELLAYLRDQLPAYAIPERILRLKALPLTPAGKLDQRRLEALFVE